MSKRTATVLALAVVLATLATLLARASAGSTDAIQTNGVLTVAVVGYARPGVAICQEGVALREPTRVLGLWGTGRLAPSPAFRVTVTETGSSEVLARGRGPAAPVETRRFRIRLDRTVPNRRPVSVCVRSEGRRLLGVIGQTPNYGEGPFATVTPRQEVLRRVRPDGRKEELEGDMRIETFRSAPTSKLDRLPAGLRRAAQFKPGWVSAPLLWAGGILFLVGAPFALARAATRAAAADVGAASHEDHGDDARRGPS